MNKEKYARQIKLFGEETQDSIENSTILILIKEHSAGAFLLTKLLRQIGIEHIHQPNDPERYITENKEEATNKWTWIFSVDMKPEIKREQIYYINTQTLCISKYHNSCPCEESSNSPSVSDDLYVLYLNILVGIAVQEYIKILSGKHGVDHWSCREILI
ncbi:hypothetical protein NEFER03_0988 [Nematocida sp. LUAm3]|nr:hypothetical protein NEFER03_0988 [Nematocida sp. LUAm3]KAI5175408.1 hypothetical protein NEFER02_1337 [Nematocida sp. LUAm2]KAI5177635.1 hypothetical protein NEFER01_0859 [Nematocida sp. LUAm1]